MCIFGVERSQYVVIIKYWTNELNNKLGNSFLCNSNVITNDIIIFTLSWAKWKMQNV